MNISSVKRTTVSSPMRHAVVFFYKVLYCLHPPGMCVLPISAFPTNLVICHKWFALSHLTPPRGELVLNRNRLSLGWGVGVCLFSEFLCQCPPLTADAGKAGLKLHPFLCLWGQVTRMVGLISTWGFLHMKKAFPNLARTFLSSGPAVLYQFNGLEVI